MVYLGPTMPARRADGAAHGRTDMGTYTLTDEQVAALAAFGITPVPTVATASPAGPKVASPFTAAAGGTAVASVVSEARRAYPTDQAAQRAAVAVSMAPLHTCTVETTATLADGSVVPSALHGFLTAKVAGEPCPGIRGLAKGTACPGTIRA